MHGGRRRSRGPVGSRAARARSVRPIPRQMRAAPLTGAGSLYCAVATGTLKAIASAFRGSLGQCHVWTTLADQGFFLPFCGGRGCGHVSGLFLRGVKARGP